MMAIIMNNFARAHMAMLEAEKREKRLWALVIQTSEYHEWQSARQEHGEAIRAFQQIAKEKQNGLAL